MKKILSLALVGSMILSSMSMAFAATPATTALKDIADSDYKKAIETLVALDVVNGYEDGTFKPGKTVTRAELAKMLVITLGYGDLVKGAKSNFTDTQGHWADAYIALAAGKGIVIGTGNGTFTPDRQVSYDEAITMVVRALGYTDSCNELKGMTWPTNFKVKAAELDLTDDVAMSTAGADRGGVAQLLFNALEATLVSVNTDGDVVFIKDGTDGKLLLSRLATKEDVKISEDSIDEDSDDYLGNIVDLAPYMYQDITAYLNDDDYVVYVKDSNSVVIEGTVDSKSGNKFVVEEADDDLITIDLANTVNTTANTVNMFYNGDEVTADIDDILTGFDKITVVGFEDEKEDNGKIDKADELVGIVVEEATDVVRVENEYVTGKAKLDGLALPTDDDKVDLTKITVTGAVDSLEDIQEDDVVTQYSSVGNTVTKLVVSRDTVEGKVTRLNDADTVSIDGKAYDLADLYMGDVLELGNDGIFFLDHNGDIADFDGTGEGPTDYAVVVGVENGNVDSKFSSVSIDNLPQIKLATQDGEEVVYDLYVELESDGDVDGTFKYGTTTLTDYFTAKVVDAVDPAEELVIETGAKAIPTNALVKYSLNADGQIDELKLVKSSFDFTDEVDFEKASNVLGDDVIVFDATDGDYDVVDVDSVPDKAYADIERNDDGDIEVVILKAGEIDSSSDVVFAYIYDADPAYDADGEKVQFAGVYTDNDDMGLYTTDDTTITFAGEGVYAIKYDGAAIDKATAIGSYTYATGEFTTGVTTATAVNAKGNMIKIDSKWYAMSENATVVDLDYSTTKSAWLEDGLADLYDITADETSFVAYINADGEIDLILIK